MQDPANSIQPLSHDERAAYENGRRAVSDLARTASETSRRAAVETDRWVHENPWLALGLVAGVGLVLGLLIAPHDD